MSGPGVADPQEERPPSAVPGGRAPLTARGGPRARRRATLIAVLIPCAVMLALGLWGLDRGTLWRDEAATAQVAGRSLPQLWHLLGTADAVHGLYYALMHGVRALLGGGETALRLPSVLGATAAAGLVALTGSRLAAPRVGLWAGLLFAAFPTVSHYAQEARSYALVTAGAALSTLLLTSAVRRGRARNWTAYAAVTALTALLHECAVLVLAAHALTLLVSRVPRAVWWRWAAAACAVALALLPLVALSRGQSHQLNWLYPPGLRAAWLLLRSFAGPSVPVVVVVCLLLAVAARRPLPRRGPLGLSAVALPLALLPAALLFVVSQWHPVFLDRYLLFSLPGVALAAAAGAERLVVAAAVRRSRRLPPRVVAAAGAAAVVVAFLCQLPAQQRERLRTGRPDDLAAVAAAVARHAAPGDGVFFVPTYERRVGLAHPERFAGLTDLTLGVSGAESGTLYGRDAPLREIRARLARTGRVWLVAADGVDRTRWFRHNDREMAKWRLLHALFVQRYWLDGPGGNIALFVRRN
ncbi:glycosyltransferase family 39 protein [Streptomyces violens]|uniref:glycosyltransferase family 39 protein n=1 Tax=Streptomyces violens TaxID=66377 RepID=UPI000692241D|nr:glycosyltransferase family 39 protein [Streptomyces violens]